MTTTVDWLIHLWTKADAWLATYGPGLALAAAITGATFLYRRISRAIQTRCGLRRLTQYANHPASRPILDDFHQPRKETP